MIKVYHCRQLQEQLYQYAKAAGITYLENSVLEQQLDNFIAAQQLNDSVWVFGYGSLIWNPQLDYCEKTIISLPQLQRKFCIYTSVGYGTKEAAGLMLGVEEKEQAICTGIAYKIEQEKVRKELFNYWQREMRFNDYIPTAFSHQHNNVIMKVVTVVANKDSAHYVDHLNIHQQAKIIATSTGIFGDNRDYLDSLVQELDKHDINDPYLKKLKQAVNLKLAKNMES